MRSSKKRFLGMLLAAFVHLAGCAWPIDDAPAAAAATTSVLPACPLLQNTPDLQGSARAVRLDGGQTLWLFDGAIKLGERRLPGLALAATPTDACRDNLAVPLAFAPTGVLAAAEVTPLDVVAVPGGAAAFFQAWVMDASQPFGVRALGTGLAEFNSALGQFVADEALLWPVEAPPYGGSALVVDQDLYAYGCVASDGGWGRSCHLARVPLAKRHEPTAWTYCGEMGAFASDPAKSVPVLVQAGDVSVQRHGALYEALYVRPLGADVELRRGLAPWGPFFAPRVLGRCEVAGNEFCSSPRWQPVLGDQTSQLDFVWNRSAFSPLSTARARPQWTRMARPKDIP